MRCMLNNKVNSLPVWELITKSQSSTTRRNKLDTLQLAQAVSRFTCSYT